MMFEIGNEMKSYCLLQKSEFVKYFLKDSPYNQTTLVIKLECILSEARTTKIYRKAVLRKNDVMSNLCCRNLHVMFNNLQFCSIQSRKHK